MKGMKSMKKIKKAMSTKAIVAMKAMKGMKGMKSMKSRAAMKSMEAVQTKGYRTHNENVLDFDLLKDPHASFLRRLFNSKAKLEPILTSSSPSYNP